MKRVVIAAVIGGVVLFIWSFASWVLIPWHMMGALPGEDSVREVLVETGAESGIYHVPMMDHETHATLSDEQKQAAEEAWEAKYREGPLALVVYETEGKSPLSPVTLGIGLVLEILIAAVAAMLLSMAAPALPGYGGRLGFVLLLGVLTIVGTHLMNWNYMHYPLRFTLEVAADALVSMLLLGLVLAALIKPYADLGTVEDVPDMAGT